MEPFPPPATSADYRQERKALVYSQIANVIAFTESPDCSDSDLQDMSIHLAVMMARIHVMASSQVPDTRFATSQLVVPRFKTQPSGSPRGETGPNMVAGLNRELIDTTDVPTIPSVYPRSSRFATDIATAESMSRQFNLGGPSTSTAEHEKVKRKVLGEPRNMRKKKMMARKLAMEETAAVDMFRNLSLRGRKKERGVDDEGLPAVGMDMDQDGD